MRNGRHNLGYQAIIYKTILKALDHHPRLMAFRCDLRFPSLICEAEFDSRVITRFFESLKAKIAADLKRKEKAWGRRLSCTLNYVWVREYGDVNERKHYHVLIFLNKDVYHSLGDYRALRDNLAAMIKQAWCSATRLTSQEFYSLTQFEKVFYFNRNSNEIDLQVERFIDYASYLAKNVTKRYGDGERSIGSSL